jgi:prepilin-type N-terminal cleavage/methylation domain-containing protein
VNIHKKDKSGFTIIEVVLVLAIAGLIFLMVFIALPALQRSQRDAQRKNDLSRAETALVSYTSNNRGSLPAASDAAWATFATNYLRTSGDTFTDPSGTDYVFKVGGTVSNTFDPANPNLVVTIGSTCNGEALTPSQGPRKVAIQMKLEGGGITCVNN